MTWCLPNLVDAHKSQTSCGFHRLTSACCVIISRRGPLKILRLSHHDFSAEFDNGWIRGIAETCGSSDGWTFSPDTRWEKKGPWRSLQRETFVIPTSQLKTATHIFRNLNRWKIDRKGHDLDLARQRAAGCGCCWSLGRCTTGQACQPLFNFGFVFFPTVSKYKVGILTVWHQAMLGLGAAGGFIWPNFLILLGQRALGRLCSSFGSLKWGGIHQQYPVHYIINFIQFHILYYYYNIIIL